MVTVKVATDNGDPQDCPPPVHVMITVTNANDAGTITFSSVQPKVRIPFTATLTDEDGVKEGTVKWQWYEGADIETPIFVGDSPTAIAIAKARKDTYTPKATPAIPTNLLYVRATYTDGEGSTDAWGKADNVVVVNRTNQAPEFREGGDKPVMQATKSVDENTKANRPL